MRYFYINLLIGVLTLSVMFSAHGQDVDKVENELAELKEIIFQTQKKQPEHSSSQSSQPSTSYH